MTLDETRRFLEVVLTLFPSFTVNKMTAQVWQTMFEVESLDACCTALKAYARDAEWPPTVAHIHKILQKARLPIGHDYTAQEALDCALEHDRASMPPLVCRAYDLSGLSICKPRAYDPNGTPVTYEDERRAKGLFIKTYEQLQEKAQDGRYVAQLGTEERKLLGQLNKVVGGGLTKLLN